MRLSLTGLFFGFLLTSILAIAGPLPITAESAHLAPTPAGAHDIVPDVHVHGAHTIPLTTIPAPSPQEAEGTLKSETTPSERLRMMKRFARQPGGADIAKQNHVPDTPAEASLQQLDRRGLLDFICPICRIGKAVVKGAELIDHEVHHH